MTILICHNCKSEIDPMSLTADQMRRPTLPNTLTNLPDHNEVEWQCPKCKHWHEIVICQQCGSRNVELESPAEGYRCNNCGATDSDE